MTTTCPPSPVSGDCGCAVYSCYSDPAGITFFALQSVSGRTAGCLYEESGIADCTPGMSFTQNFIDPDLIECSAASASFVDKRQFPAAPSPYHTTTAAPVLNSPEWVSTGNTCPSRCISGLFGLARTAVSGFFPRWYPPATGTLDPDTGKIGAPYHQLYHSPHQAKCENPCGTGGWMVPASEYGERIHAGLTPAPCTYIWTGKWTLIEYYHTVNGSGVYGDECSSAGGTCIPPAVPDYPPPNGTIGYGGCCKSGFYTTTTTTTTPTTTTTTTSTTPPPTTTTTSTTTSTTTTTTTTTTTSTTTTSTTTTTESPSSTTSSTTTTSTTTTTEPPSSTTSSTTSTSTTTTTLQPCGSGTCSYIWNGSSWDLGSDTCSTIGPGSCACAAPVGEGTILGESQETDCEPV